MKKFLSILLAGALIFSLAACSFNVTTEISVDDLAVIHEPEFGGVYIKMTIDEFNALGFKYGDGVKISFSNGYSLNDVPYYNGYYTANGESLLVAYPGYDYIKACINNGDDLFEIAKLDESMTASIELVKQGEFADIQDARDIHYTDERSDYDSDIVFANFRFVQAGDIQPNTLFRSASPCDNQHGRATFVNALAMENGIAYIMDLADTDEKIQGYISADDFACDYFLKLYNDGKVDPVGLNSAYESEGYQSKLAAALTKLAYSEGPFLVHCTEGKDRTGFACALLEMLCGARYDEIEADYMITYDNYYGINKTDEPQRYEVIVESLLHPILKAIVKDGDIKAENNSVAAEKFLLNAGMTQSDINLLKNKLTGK